MKAIYGTKCTVCNAEMMYVQRRGASEGMLVCPVCASKRQVPSAQQEEVSGVHDITTQMS